MTWFRSLSFVVSLALAGACHVGPQIAETSAARLPQGASVLVELTRKVEGERVERSGELLEIRDDGVVFAGRSEANNQEQIIFAPWKIVYRVRATELPNIAMRQSQSSEAKNKSMEKLRIVSRYPQTLPPELMKKLLANYGQTTFDAVE